MNFYRKLYFSIFICSISLSQQNIPPRVLPKVWDPAFSEYLTTKPKVIILVTAFRSGSTFMGELFNQNPDILYDFETFHAGALSERKGQGNYKGEDPRHTDDELNMLMLQQLINNCTIMPSVFLNALHKYWRCPKTTKEMMELFGEETCKENDWFKGPSIKELRQYLCRKRDAVVLKVIRLRRLKDLELIKNIHKADVKVIQLLRDPRGMFRSRGGFKDIFQIRRHQLQWTHHEKWTKLAYEAHTECESYINDIEYAENSPWLRNRYMKVKHDDMATQYLEIAQKLYDFIGLPLPNIVKDFLEEAVNAEDPADNQKDKAGDVGKGGTLNTIKNSKAVNDKWLNWSIDNIRNVDRHCARLIRKMNWPFLLEDTKRFFEFEPIN
ncbi:carbohydrate sulfotransferase 1-like [Bolinopsis microptera]|uniref:carbohydrate sulfotransferase 1-like n=1 Tax=Bolinopsis microptera TaxID=2820187 RepID=UPI003079FB72